MLPSRDRLPAENSSGQKARDARASLRDQCRVALHTTDAHVIAPSDPYLEMELPLANVRETLSRYVVAWREAQATPERMLIDLKGVLNEVTAPLEPETRRRVYEEIIGWSIEEYYSR